MPTRSEHLNRLKIESPCRTSGEHMQGDGAERFCTECRRQVVDFAKLSPREIEGRLRASNGSLCARLTWRGGQLVVAPDLAEPEPDASWNARRFPAFTAGMFAAWLAAAPLAARASEPPVGIADVESPPAPSEADEATAEKAAPGPATLSGTVSADGQGVPGAAIVARNLLDGSDAGARTDGAGMFLLSGLRSGLYEIAGTSSGFSITSQTLVVLAGESTGITLVATPGAEVSLEGSLAMSSLPLRRAFEDSELVVIATTGGSEAASSDGDTFDMVTTLSIESALKGELKEELKASETTLRHYGISKANGEFHAETPAGARVVAFLHSSRMDQGHVPASFEASVLAAPIEVDNAQTETLREQLEGLAGLEREAAAGNLDPAALMEWIVESVENPATRALSIEDLEAVVYQTATLAAKEGVSFAVVADRMSNLVESFVAEGGKLRSVPDQVLGGFLTAQQKRRVTALLTKTQGVPNADLALPRIVRRWDEPAAMKWLLRQLEAEDFGSDTPSAGRLIQFAFAIDDEATRALAETASQEATELQPQLNAENAAGGGAAARDRLAALVAGLRWDLEAALIRKLDDTR